MKILMFDRVPEATAWAKQRIGLVGASGDVTTVSLVDDNNQFQAVTVYSAYTSQNIDMHIAALPGRNWLSRNYFNASFYLPFRVLQVPRVTGLIKAGNELAPKFVERLGFQYEGRMRKAFEDGSDLLLYGFLLEEYQQHPWSKYEINGRLIQFGPGSPAEAPGAPDGSSGEARSPAPVARRVVKRGKGKR
jgi:RimJ/RimL family protein N-acetyltransferase